MNVIQSQKLQQVHQLVLQFQALERDLKDTFEEIETNHQNELKKLQQQLNQAKGIEQSEENTNPMWGQAQMKKNPLSNKPQNNMASPRSSSNQNGYSYNAYNKNNANSYNQNGGWQQQQQQQQTRPANGSIYSQQYTPLPGQVAPSRNNHNKNNTAMQYQPQQRSNGWHAKQR